MTLGFMAHSILKFSIMTLSVITHRMVTLSIIAPDDIQHNDSNRNFRHSRTTLKVLFTQGYFECCSLGQNEHADCRYV